MIVKFLILFGYIEQDAGEGSDLSLLLFRVNYDYRIESPSWIPHMVAQMSP